MLSLIFGLSLGLFFLWQSYRTLEVQNLRKTWRWSYIINYIKEKEVEVHGGGGGGKWPSHGHKITKRQSLKWSRSLCSCSGCSCVGSRTDSSVYAAPLLGIKPIILIPWPLTPPAPRVLGILKVAPSFTISPDQVTCPLSALSSLNQEMVVSVPFPSFPLQRQCVARTSWKEAFYRVRV